MGAIPETCPEVERRRTVVKQSDVTKREKRHDRLIRERVHDPYKTRLKLQEPTVCPGCGAVFHRGRWHWEKTRPEGANEEMCQACHRSNDSYPAGEVTLSGGFLRVHREEILNLARNVEETEKAEHPRHRIMAIDDRADRVLITTTDIHLPRRIGQAVFNAYKGEFDFKYDEEGYFIRVSWSRDA